MLILEAIDLVRNKPPQDVTPEEVAALRECMERNPSVCEVLGGLEVVEDFIAAVESAAQKPAPVSEANEPAEAAATALPSRRQVVEIAVWVTGFVVILAGIYLFLFGVNLPPWLAEFSQADSEVAAIESAGGEADEDSPQQKNPDTKKSAAAGRRHRGRKPWQGWEIHVEKGGYASPVADWNLVDPGKARYNILLKTGAGEVRLTRRQRVTAEKSWLRIHIVPEIVGEKPGHLEVRVDGVAIARAEVPPPATDYPKLVWLGSQIGKEVELEVVHQAGEKDERIFWRNLGLIHH